MAERTEFKCRHPELAEAAGAECLFGDPGGHVATLTLQELTASDPDCIIFAPCGEPVNSRASESRLSGCGRQHEVHLGAADDAHVGSG